MHNSMTRFPKSAKLSTIATIFIKYYYYYHYQFFFIVVYKIHFLRFILLQ